jgi:glc operon protein GlcG
MALRHVVSTLTLAQATAIATHAIAAGRRERMLPLAVVVVDAGGQIVTAQRDDGCGTLRVRIAQGKARGALGMGLPSRTIRDRLQNRPAFQSAVATASQGQFIPVPGGVLILDGDGRAIGAVGISGDTSDRDEYCAIEGIKATGLGCDPPEPAPDWRESAL